MKPQKRKDLPGVLYVVATPIGNLGDFSSRAVELCRQAQVIFCEDTRNTLKWVHQFGIKGPALERMDQNLDPQRLEQVISHYLAKERVDLAGDHNRVWVLVSDAGSPGLSDPGPLLVQKCRELGFQVSPVPGPSALMALLSVSDRPIHRFSFQGFFPRERKDAVVLLKQVSAVAECSGVCFWFESPRRILATLELVEQVARPSTLWIGKELTKVFERIWIGAWSETRKEIEAEIEREGEKGEWVFGVEFLPVEEPSGESVPWEEVLKIGLASGARLSTLSESLAELFGVSKNAVYDWGLDWKRKMEKHSKKDA